MKEINFEVEEKGLDKQVKHCPNCDSSLTVYTNEKGIIEKSSDVTLIDSHHVKCNYCKSILKY